MIQTVIIIAISPLLSGFIRKVKNLLRMRRGMSVFQPYYNIAKLFSKDEVVSRDASWIFSVAPVVVLSSSVAACFLLPALGAKPFTNIAGDLLVIFFILALGRFFLALAGLDTGSAFGGMGSSREMFISSIAEPAVFISIFALGINYGSTSAAAIAGGGAVRLSVILASSALFMVAIAETSRIPIDNQETHLELTMIHEAMILEYSGRSLAMIELAGHIKQFIFFTIISLALPAFVPGWPFWLSFPLRLIIISMAVAVIEISFAKMRLFRAVDYLTFALFIAFAAAAAAITGV